MDNNLLHSSKHGFHKKRSTQTALINVVDEWLSNIDNGQITAVIFLDLAKALDTVKHSILVKKLQALENAKNLDWELQPVCLSAKQAQLVDVTAEKKVQQSYCFLEMLK